MQALVFDGVGRIRFVTDQPLPKLERATDAVVKVKLCAICGSDLHPFRGDERGLAPGTVVGHEFVGTIVELGSEVRGLKIGDRVAAPFTASCGACFYCQRGATCRCEHAEARLFGWRSEPAAAADGTTAEAAPEEGLHGTNAQYVRVPLAASTLVKLPDAVSDELGLLLGDILSTAFFCADQAGVGTGGYGACSGGSKGAGDSSGEAGNEEGELAVVVGAGPVGLLAAMAARARGAARVFSVDGVPGRRAAALKLGADAAFAPDEAAAAVRAATGGRGADRVLECVGAPAALALAFELVRPAGAVGSVGVQVGAGFPFTPVDAYNKNASLRFGRCPARAYMEALLPLAAGGEWQFTNIVTHRLPLSEGVDAYRRFEAREEGVIKIVLDPWG